LLPFGKEIIPLEPFNVSDNVTIGDFLDSLANIETGDL